MDAAMMRRMFSDVSGRITSQACYLSHRYHIPHDEVLSECYYAFVDACQYHDPTKSRFETWLISRMRFQIMRFIEKQGRLSLREVSFTDYGLVDPVDDRELLHRHVLSDDAITAIALALKPPEPVLNECLRLGGEKKHLCAALRHHFHKHGWSCGRVRKTFLEVREALERYET